MPNNEEIEQFWNHIDTAEQIQSASKAYSQGLISSFCILIAGATAGYALDTITILIAATIVSLFTFPASSSSAWEKEKPILVYRYLTAKILIKQYCNQYKIPANEILVIFQATIQKQVKGINKISTQNKCWVALTNGGIIIVSENISGMRLEFASICTKKLIIRKTNQKDLFNAESLVLEGFGPFDGAIVAIRTKSKNSMIKFEKSIPEILKKVSDLKKLPSNWN